jgi:hypothetical protein
MTDLSSNWVAGAVMTMTQQEKDALRNNWEAAKSQIAQKFPNVNADDLGNDPDRASSTLASKTGQDASQVEATLKQVAQQYV